jgi:alpha-tubulin suppressor-like RCC1 family protein
MRPTLSSALLIVAIGGCPAPAAPMAQSVVVPIAPPAPASGPRPLTSPSLPGGRVKKLAAAPGHTCALLTTGQVACWGGGIGPLDRKGYRTNVKRPRIFPGITDAIDVATGIYHGCAVKAGGDVVCWGSNSDGQLGSGQRHVAHDDDAFFVVPKLHDIVEIASRAEHTCARRSDGRVLCWGKNESGQVSQVIAAPGIEADGPSPVNGVDDAVELATAHTQSCARRANGHVVCWGEWYPQPAQGGGLRDLSSVTDAVALSVDSSRACLVRANGDVACVAGTNRADVPIGDAVDIADGGGATCAVKKSGQVVCWGGNVSGELGDGTTTSREIPKPVIGLDDATQVVASWNHFCALRRDGEVACWGANDTAQLGIGSDDVESEPFAVPGVKGSKVVVGPEQSCALAPDGKLVCWGHDVTRSQMFWRAAAGPVPGLTGPVADVAVGRWHGCAVTKVGATFCWGNPTSLGAQLPYRDDSSVRPIANAVDAVAITTGERHACVRKTSGKVLCWGQNDRGQLGDGTTRPSTAAVEVKGLADVVEVSCGDNHTCARRANGAVVCWGANEAGQIGAFDSNGDPSPASPVFVPVSALRSPAVALGAGTSSTCALAKSGVVTCWGHNHRGRVVCSHPGGCKGDRFVDVPGVTDAKLLAVGGWKSCVVRGDGAISCWTKVVEATTDLAPGPSMPAVSAVAAESSHTCAISSGAVRCWGRNEAGQVGAPPPFRTSPVSPVW